MEAFNGGWAVLGLTAGLVIEGYTGKSILYQVCVLLLCVGEYTRLKWFRNILTFTSLSIVCCK